MDEKREIGKRIKAARESAELTQQELGDKLGLNKSSIQRYETGKITKIKQPILEKIGIVLKVNPKWLSLESEDAEYSEETAGMQMEDLIKRFDNIKAINLKRFPMLGEIACGKPIFADEDRESYVMADMDINADFCLTAKGDSMINARINDGDIVFIKEMPMVNNGEIAAVIIEDEATLKKVYYYPEKGKIVLYPENPKYEPFVYIGEELNQIRILGKAVYFMSSL